MAWASTPRRFSSSMTWSAMASKSFGPAKARSVSGGGASSPFDMCTAITGGRVDESADRLVIGPAQRVGGGHDDEPRIHQQTRDLAEPPDDLARVLFR